MSRITESLQFQALLEAAPDAMVIVGQDGLIAHTNARTEALFGYERGELLGQPIESLIPERFRSNHPAQRLRYFGDPVPRPMGSGSGELYGLRKDGTEFPAEISLSPMRGDERMLVIAAIRDGTARRRSEEKVRRLLEAAPDAMVITNEAGRIVLVNAQAERLFGYSREDMLGQPVEMLIPKRYRAAHPAHRASYVREPRVRPMGAGLALFGLRSDGTEFPAEISLSPLETDEGTLAITAVRDLTERKRAEEEKVQLKQAEEAIRLRDEFLSIASHELKTPLTALQMQVDGVLRSARRPGNVVWPEPAVAKLETMRSAIHRLNGLIEQLLDVSRITAGRLVLEREEVDLVGLTCGVVTQFEDELTRSGCTISIDAPLPIVGLWDTLRLEQIVTNLLSNAIKYGSGKPIEVSIHEHDGLATLSIRDHGIGIDPEHQARIFERFERVVSQRNFGGFGLGLWIVRQLIEVQGGNIRVWSQPGAGTMFTVEMPTALEKPVPTGEGERATAKPCIMVVDDDELIRSSLAELISEEGYLVETAANGKEALSMLRAGLRPRVVMLDLMMPVMDAWAFRMEQTRDPALAPIPTVVVSASRSIASQAADLGATAYLKKPIDVDQMFKLLQQYAP